MKYRIKKMVQRLWDGDITIYRVQKKGWLGWYYIGEPYTRSEVAARNQIEEHKNKKQTRKTEIIDYQPYDEKFQKSPQWKVTKDEQDKNPYYKSSSRMEKTKSVEDTTESYINSNMGRMDILDIGPIDLI